MHSQLLRELEQRKQDLESSPFSNTNLTNTSHYPLREVSLGQRKIGNAKLPFLLAEKSGDSRRKLIP